MSVYEERERGFEAGFAHDEEQAFRAQARRDRALGYWMGGRLGLEGDRLEEYVLSVWRADLKEPGDADVFAKLMDDAKAAGVRLDEADLRLKMQECLAAAREELERG